jgi:hypothetical protein
MFSIAWWLLATTDYQGPAVLATAVVGIITAIIALFRSKGEDTRAEKSVFIQEGEFASKQQGLLNTSLQAENARLSEEVAQLKKDIADQRKNFEDRLIARDKQIDDLLQTTASLQLKVRHLEIRRDPNA